MANRIKIGLIGCGSFGLFCLNAFSGMEEVKIAAVADIDEDTARETGQKYQVEWFTSPEVLINHPDVQLVHLVTPPYTHFELGIKAASKGKHVLCEKPLALTIKEGRQMLEIARQNNVLMPVNFVLRYVPLVSRVKKIIDHGILGDPIRAYFENYATDQNLDSHHWFWNKKMSGGIFVEHSVHFFDLYRYWFGNSEVIWASVQKRELSGQEDRVFSVSKHQNGVLATQYHGFDQPAVLDRQVHRLVFERGDMIVSGWIPEKLSIEAIVNEERLKVLRTIIPDGEIRMQDISSSQKIKGRGKDIEATLKINLIYGSLVDKLTLYREAIIHLLRDQLHRLNDPDHFPVISEENGLEALKLAIQAAQKSV